MHARRSELAKLGWFVPVAAVGGDALLTHHPLAVVPALALAVAPFAAERWKLARLGKELRAIELPAVALLAGPALADAAGQAEPATFLFAFLAPLLVAASLGVELEPSTWTGWWLQPRSFRALLLEKLAVCAGVLALGFAQVAVGAKPAALELPLLGALMALGVAPALTLVTRHALAGGLVAGATAELFVAAFHGFGPDTPPIYGGPQRPAWLVISLAALFALGSGGLTLRRLPELIAAPPGSGPRQRRFSTPGVRPLWRALVGKELRLQLPTAAVAGAGLAVAVANAWLGHDEVVEPLALFFGLVCGALAGVCAVAGEHRHGTALADASAAPVAFVWRVKVLVTAGAALACGLALPVLEISALYGLRHALQEATNHSAWVLNASGVIFAAGWMAMVVGLAAVGLIASAVVHDLARAFVATLAAGAALLGLMGAISTATSWAIAALYWGSRSGGFMPAFGLPNLHLGEALAQRLLAVLVVVPALVLCRLALAQARRSWPLGRVELRWQPFAALVATGLLTGVGISGLELVRWYSAFG